MPCSNPLLPSPPIKQDMLKLRAKSEPNLRNKTFPFGEKDFSQRASLLKDRKIGDSEELRCASLLVKL